RGAKDATEAARASYAVAAATDAARSSGPFEPAYSALQAVLPNDPNVAALAPLARKGAPTREELRDEYAKLELEVVRAARAAEAGGGVWGQVQASMAQFIVVRRASDVDISGDLVDSASARLAANDFEGAVAQLSRLTGEPARRVAPWLAKAKMRVEIDQRLAAIRTQLSRKG
ncbi:MAG: COG4223 family protein, partial [Hyphomonadaceae bacterium]